MNGLAVVGQRRSFPRVGAFPFPPGTAPLKGASVGTVCFSDDKTFHSAFAHC